MGGTLFNLYKPDGESYYLGATVDECAGVMLSKSHGEPLDDPRDYIVVQEVSGRHSSETIPITADRVMSGGVFLEKYAVAWSKGLVEGLALDADNEAELFEILNRRNRRLRGEQRERDIREISDLYPHQELAARMLARGSKQREVARHLRVHETTLHRWKAKPGFQGVYEGELLRLLLMKRDGKEGVSDE